jgi:hypothetical protein
MEPVWRCTGWKAQWELPRRLATGLALCGQTAPALIQACKRLISSLLNRAGGRHDDAGFVAHHAADQFGLGGLAGQDDRAAVAARIALAPSSKRRPLVCTRAVAAETGAFEDGLDVPGKVNRRLRHRPGGDA